MANFIRVKAKPMIAQLLADHARKARIAGGDGMSGDGGGRLGIHGSTPLPGNIDLPGSIDLLARTSNLQQSPDGGQAPTW